VKIYFTVPRAPEVTEPPPVQEQPAPTEQYYY
jgi:hypothetical protein